MSVITPAEAKAHLNMLSAASDAELLVFIDAAEAGLSKRIGPLTATATTSRVRGESPSLQLPVTPVVSLTSVTPFGGTPLSLTDLFVTESGQVESGSGYMYFTHRWYDVAYVAGRTATEDLRHAIREVVRHLWVTQRGAGRRPASVDEQALVGAAYAFTYRARELFDPFLQVPIGGA